MATTDDARARARRIVEETLREAGLVIPLDSPRDVPPAPPNPARQAAHRIVEAAQREHEEARRRAEQALIAVDEPPELLDVADPAPSRSPAPGPARSSANGSRVRGPASDGGGTASSDADGSGADDVDVGDGEAPSADAASSRVDVSGADGSDADGSDADSPEADHGEVGRAGAESSDAVVLLDVDSDAAARARQIVDEVLAAEAAEVARRAEAAERRSEELGTDADQGPELFADRAGVEPPPESDPEPTAEMFEDTEPAVELATEPELEFETVVAAPPTPQVDLLPAEPASPPPTDTAAPQVIDEPAPELDEPPLPGGPAIGGPPPPPLAAVDGWWQTIRERYRRRQAMAEWAPDATRPPRRTGRWLLVTILGLGAIVLLYPMAVDALRQLVAL